MKKQSGFSLIELLVVITIIAILSAVGIAAFRNVTSDARDAKRKADIDAIVKAYETKYDADRGIYPVLTDSAFTSGSKPTPPEGGSYTLPSTEVESFQICTLLDDAPDSTTCTGTSDVCYCRQSSQGKYTVAELPPDEEPPPPPAPPAKKVFVTSITYNGNLMANFTGYNGVTKGPFASGLEGADSRCQDRADVANLGGTWKAWLSDDTGSPLTRFTPSATGYEKVDGTIVASSWEDFIDPATPLLSGIDKTESGGNGGGVYVFSNTTAAGGIQNTDLNRHCNRWTYSAGQSYGSNLGLSGQTDSKWAYLVPGGCNDAWSRALYCFEQ